MGNVDAKKRNGMFVLEMLLCGTMNYGCLCLTVLPVSWIRVNQWNTSVKCSDKCTHLCFYYVIQWIMQNWSSAIHSYYGIALLYNILPIFLHWRGTCHVLFIWKLESPQTNSNRHIHYYWMNELRNKSWTKFQIHLMPFFLFILAYHRLMSSHNSLNLAPSFFSSFFLSFFNVISLSNQQCWFTFNVGKNSLWTKPWKNFEPALKAVESGLLPDTLPYLFPFNVAYS